MIKKSLKKMAVAILIMLICLGGLGSAVYAFELPQVPMGADITLLVGGPGGQSHTITSWKQLKTTSFGNGDTIDLQMKIEDLGDYMDAPKNIHIPEALKDLRIAGSWVSGIVLKGEMRLSILDGTSLMKTMTAPKNLTLNIEGNSVFVVKDRAINFGGELLTFEGMGNLVFTDLLNDASIIYGDDSYTVKLEGPNIANVPMGSDGYYGISLFSSAEKLSVIQNGGIIAGVGIRGDQGLDTVINDGVMQFEGYESGFLGSEDGTSSLTLNGGLLKVKDGTWGEPLDVDTIAINGGSLMAKLKCDLPENLYAWSSYFVKPPYAAVDVYNSAGEHRPARLDEEGKLFGYFPEGEWTVSHEGQVIRNFTIDAHKPLLLESVPNSLKSMKNGDVLDLSMLVEREDRESFTLPAALTSFTLSGNPKILLYLSFIASQQSVPLEVTLKNISVTDAKGRDPLFQNTGSMVITTEGTCSMGRRMVSTVGGSVRLVGDGTMMNDADDSLIYATGDTSLLMESGTYQMDGSFLSGADGVSLEYNQKGGQVSANGNSFVTVNESANGQGTLMVNITNGNLDVNCETAAFKSEGNLIYKQSSGSVEGSRLMESDVTQFAIIDGEMKLAADDAIQGGTVNGYLGGGVMRIDGKNSFAVNSEKDGVFIQRGGLLTTHSDGQDYTMHMDNHFIESGSIFANFKTPILEGKEVRYEVHDLDGSLYSNQKVTVRGPVSFETQTNTEGLLHMYLPEGNYQVLNGDTLLGSFDAADNVKVITDWQQLDVLLKNSEGNGLRNNDIVDISAMAGVSGDTYNIALPAWLDRATFVSQSGKFINARFSLAEGREKQLALTVENMYIRPTDGHGIDIALPADKGGASLIFSGDNSIQIKDDITAAGIRVADVTYTQSEEWFEVHPGTEKVLSALIIDGKTDDFGNAASLLVNSEASLGAAIGGGMYEGAGDITIENGNIQAIGGEGAGIGGGSKYGEGGKITINNGYISAESLNGTPIGGGSNADGGNIAINGGNVSCINRNTESDGTVVGSLGYAKGFTSFAPASSKDNVISEASVALKNCNIRAYNHEKTEQATFAAAKKDLATARLKITFLGSDNKPLSDYGIQIRNIDTDEIVSIIKTWRSDRSGSAGLVYTYLPDGRYRFESVSAPGKIATNSQFPDGILVSGSLINIEGIVLKFN